MAFTGGFAAPDEAVLAHATSSGVPLNGTLVVSTATPREGFVALLGDGAIDYGGGGPRIDIVEVPNAVSFTIPRGTDPLTIGVPFILDAKIAGIPDVQKVRAAAERLRRRTNAKPPPVRFDTGGAVLNDRTLASDLWWWADIDWGAAMARGGRLVRQAGVLRLTQKSDDEPRRVTSTKNTSVSAGASSTYTVKRGDTLSKIALDKLGKASRWPEILALNGLRDPRAIKPGQRLQLPPR